VLKFCCLLIIRNHLIIKYKLSEPPLNRGATAVQPQLHCIHHGLPPFILYYTKGPLDYSTAVAPRWHRTKVTLFPTLHSHALIIHPYEQRAFWTAPRNVKNKRLLDTPTKEQPQTWRILRQSRGQTGLFRPRYGPPWAGSSGVRPTQGNPWVG
jgi:hypothetical protein